MGRRLSLLCCPCLPTKQRDNLSSRSLYLDQDSSGQDDYSDDDDEYQAHSSLLTSLGPSSSSPNTHHTQPNYNPWPSSFSNGRFSRHSTLTGKRKSNPFRGFTSSPEQEGEDERRSSSEGGERDMKPYRDDESDHERDTHEREEDNALNNPTAVHAQTHYAPYRVSALPQPFSPQQQHSTADGKRIRPPRNPQGKMAWFDGEDEDAEEVIDVDALIAEQERITRQLAAQEEALRQEEEATVVSKRLAAIRAAEKRGLLRFDGDHLVIESSKTESKEAMSIQEQPTKSQMSSSAASSFVGGIDVFNQELKMMTFEMSSSNIEKNCKDSNAKERQDNTRKTVSRSSSTSRAKDKPVTKTRSASSHSVTKASTGVSTSTSTSTSTSANNQSAINPRDVLNNITSFLKKVDGVIAGEGSSSDEASFSDQEQALSKSSRSSISATNAPHGPQGLGTSSTTTNKPTQGPQGLTDTKSKSHYSTATAAATATKVTPVAIEIESTEQYPTNPFNTTSDDHDNESYPTDLFNGPSHSTPQPAPAQEPVKQRTPGSMPEFSSQGSTTAKPLAPAPAPAPKAGEQPAYLFSSFTSLFNTGSSFVGGYLFGGGANPDTTSGQRGASTLGRVSPSDNEDEDDHPYDDGNYHQRLSSSAKYGNPQEHKFDHQEHYQSKLEASVVVDRAKRVKEEDDDDASIDDYDF
ncbi:hypothetical protein CPC16_010991 [Podila verticillata]|nr:hypothetical protein CPC16_010991 [Podila verticillata]KAI9239867.1 MAG: hypothetical protein BYD32DRAFT_434543 [Podila humilis]